MSTARTYGSATDEALVIAIAHGDCAAFEAFIRRHTSRSTAVAQRIVGDRRDAEEIVQDAFLRIWRHAARWQPGRARPTTWVHRIVVNLAIDRLRKNRSAPVPVDHSESQSYPACGADALAEARELEAGAVAAISVLPARQRTAILLSSVGAMECTEAANRMHVSVSAMESLLVRGRRTLRQRLRPFGIGTHASLQRLREKNISPPAQEPPETYVSGSVAGRRYSGLHGSEV